MGREGLERGVWYFDLVRTREREKMNLEAEAGG